jgi:hypothetical protein
LSLPEDSTFTRPAPAAAGFCSVTPPSRTWPAQGARTFIVFIRWSRTKTLEEMMPENPQDPLDVPMDRVLTRNGGSSSEGSEPKGAVNPKESGIEGRHTQDTVDPAERLPEDPEEQNDLA